MDELNNNVTTEQTPSDNTRPVVEPINGISNYAENAGLEQKSALPTVALVLGIISAASVLLCCCCGQWYITLGLGVAAVICGFVARSKGFKNGKTLAAIILGFIGAFFGLLTIIFSILFTLTSGMIMAPFFEAFGINMEELIALIESGATDAEIEEWIEQQMGEAGFVMEAKAHISVAFNSVRGFFGK